MRTAVADELEAFIEGGGLWVPEVVQGLVQRLEAEAEATGDPLPAQLSRSLASVLWRLRLGQVPTRLAADVEAIVYPRLWKVGEAVRAGMDDGEVRTRIEVLGRRLARTFAEEQR